jgi:hypothetical protein
MHANGSTGPQIGYAAVMQDGTIYRSSEKRPAMALSDIATQISRANTDRYAVGKPAHDAPSNFAQILPLFANSNPRIDAMLSGLPVPTQQIGCMAGAHALHPRRSDASLARRRTDKAEHDSGLGWTERVA